MGQSLRRRDGMALSVGLGGRGDTEVAGTWKTSLGDAPEEEQAFLGWRDCWNGKRLEIKQC